MGGKRIQVNLDTILFDIGQFGKSQRLTYLMIALPIMCASMYNLNYNFTARHMSYRCLIPECDVENTPLEADWLFYAMPNSKDPRRCSRFAPSLNTSMVDSTCSPDAFDQNTVIGCDKFVFEGGQSIVKELEIQCDGWKRTLVGTIHSVGLLCALPLVSIVSDRYGRRLAFVSASFLAGVLGLARSFSTSYVMFLIFEFLEPLFGSGVFSAGFILGMELVGPKRRVLGSTIICMFYSSGAMLLGLIAWLIPYWRDLLRVLYAPSLIFIVYFWLIQESVRWLISKGQYEKAVEILKKAAKRNGTTLSEKSMESLNLNAENKHAQVEAEPKKEQSAFMQCLKSKVIMVRLVTCSFWWITCTFTYYGLSINAVSLTGNIYLNFVLVSLVELPAYMTGYLVLDRIGRKSTLCISFIAGGIACIGFPLLPEDIEWLSLTFYLLGKYFITIAFSSLYVYTSELFPTCLRHSLLGTCSMIGRIGSIVAPQTPLLAEYVPGLPSYLFGSFAILSGLLMLTSPETLNIKLPDTIEEAENIVRKKKSPKKAKTETP